MTDAQQLEWRHQRFSGPTVQRCVVDGETWPCAAEQQRQEVARLRGALEKYGGHFVYCHRLVGPVHQMYNTRDYLPSCFSGATEAGCRCTCGLDDALSGRGGA